TLQSLSGGRVYGRTRRIPHRGRKLRGILDSLGAGRREAGAVSALDLDRLLRGRGCGGHAEVRRVGRALAQLDDPEAVDAIRDLQRVGELVEQLGGALE